MAFLLLSCPSVGAHSLASFSSIKDLTCLQTFALSTLPCRFPSTTVGIDPWSVRRIFPLLVQGPRLLAALLILPNLPLFHYPWFPASRCPELPHCPVPSQVIKDIVIYLSQFWLYPRTLWRCKSCSALRA